MLSLARKKALKKAISWTREYKLDVAVVVSLACLVAACFWRVLLLGVPVSKVCLLANRDVLFRRYFSTSSVWCDESVFLLLAPYYQLIAQYWRHLELPLWNPYCGWGIPLLGDIQAAAFSPIRLLFALNPSMYQYNLLIILEIFVAVLGTYLLSRQLSLGKLVSVLVALTYGFCPYFLFFLELLTGTSAALLPCLFWLFIRITSHPTIKRAVACAAGCAIFIASGHPEASFLGIVFATLLMVLIFSLRQEKISGLKWTATVAVFAICFAAPLLLPFIENLAYSDCYKFTSHHVTKAPEAVLLLNLLQPMYSGASPYLGILAVALMVIAPLVSGAKKLSVIALLVSSSVVFICTCRPLFFQFLFDLTPAKFVPSSYCLPAFLLQLALLSGFGAEVFTNHLRIGKNRPFLLFCAAAFGICFLPPAFEWWHYPFKLGNFENGLADMAFSYRGWIVTSALACCAFSLLLLEKIKRIPKRAVSIGLILITFGSLCFANRKSLPEMPPFNYDEVAPLAFLKEKNERVMSLGFDVLSPNTNAAYRINSVNTHNVMHPDRYVDFMMKAGANCTTFNTVVDRVPITNLLDYAGIRYVVSLAPVFGEGDAGPEPKVVSLGPGISFENYPNLKLTSASIAYDSRKAESRGILKFEVPEDETNRFLYSVVVLGQDGNPLWFGGMYSLQAGGRSSSQTDVDKNGSVALSALVPIHLKHSQKFFVGVQVFDTKSCKFVVPAAKPPFTSFSPVVCLSEFSFLNPDKGANDIHYSLISESGPQKVRVYKNTRSLGRAFMVFQHKHANSPDEALQLIGNKNFDGFSTVILEGERGALAPEVSGIAKKGVSINIDDYSPNHLQLNTNCSEDGFLVLTDTFFPGWTATVDNRPTEILRANYLFRAVRVCRGAHKVVFTYQPITLGFSLVLFFAGVLASIFFVFKERGERE